MLKSVLNYGIQESAEFRINFADFITVWRAEFRKRVPYRRVGLLELDSLTVEPSDVLTFIKGIDELDDEEQLEEEEEETFEFDLHNYLHTPTRFQR